MEHYDNNAIKVFSIQETDSPSPAVRPTEKIVAKKKAYLRTLSHTFLEKELYYNKVSLMLGDFFTILLMLPIKKSPHC